MVQKYYQARLLPVLSLLMALSAQSVQATNAATAQPSYPKEFRIGYQKGNSLVILKASGELEKTLAPYGVSVKWYEFPFGPPMIEAINTGNIDLGYVGATPPVLAQAGGAPEVRYVGYTAPYKDNYAVVVPKESAALSLKDLKGKKIAVAKGAAGQYLLLKALEREGLTPDDIIFSYLQYSESRSAFERGDVAAWVVPDPRLADIEESIGARPIVTASQLPPQYGFFIAPHKFAVSYPAVLRTTLQRLNATEQYAKNHLEETAVFLEKDTHVPKKIWLKSLSRQAWGISFPLTQNVIDSQQDVANIFYKYHLIPRVIQVKNVVIPLN